VNDVVAALAEASVARLSGAGNGASMAVPADLQRKSEFLTHPVFNTHHTELELQRYIKRLENKDFSLMHGMIPLGSCTMKLNAASTLMPLTWPEWGGLHPFAPVEQTGATRRCSPAERCLAKATGFTAVSLQPNSGAQGEYAGLLVIRAYHEARGDHKRNIALIPAARTEPTRPAR
jgi:glycine dehydrogenase